MSDCILWKGRLTPQGYGAIGSRKLAHRVAWEEANGPIPEGHQIHHNCRVRACVNPDHLVCMTALEHNRLHGNAEPWYERQRAITHCPQGHEYTPENTIKKRGSRRCRECTRASNREYYERNRATILPAMRERARARRHGDL